jgi:hypothetical protein
MLIKAISKLKDLKLIILLISLIIFMGVGSKSTFDYLNYKWSYENLLYSSFEPAYLILEDFVFTLGIEYVDFRLLIGILVTLLNFYFPIKILRKKDLLVFILCYFLISLPFFSYNLRSAIAFSIINNYLISICQNMKFSKIHFILIIFIASLFHTSSLIYLIFLFLPTNFKLSLKYSILFIFVILISVILTLLPNVQIFIINIFFNLILIPLGVDESKLIYTIQQGNLGFLLFIFSMFLFFFYFYSSKGFLNSNTSNLKHRSPFNRSFFYLLLYSSILLFILFPFLRLNTEFSRIIRGISPFYIFGMIYISSNYISRFKLISNVLLILIFAYHFLLYVFPYMNETFYPLFEIYFLNI